MKCNVVTDPMGRMVATICGRGGRAPKPKPCYRCKAPSLTLCDGPPRAAGATTCDRSVCRGCSEHLSAPSNGQAWDSSGLDVCRDCLDQAPLPIGCAVAEFQDGPLKRGPVPQACEGPVIPAQGVCWRHVKLWTRWLLAGGWDEVYAKPIPKEAKRARFIEWLDQQPANAR